MIIFMGFEAHTNQLIRVSNCTATTVLNHLAIPTVLYLVPITIVSYQEDKATVLSGTCNHSVLSGTCSYSIL